MKALSQRYMIAVFIIAALLLPNLTVHADGSELVFSGPIESWQIRYLAEDSEPSALGRGIGDEGDWITVGRNEAATKRPDGVTIMWIKLVLPDVDGQAGLYLEKLYAQKVAVYMNNDLKFQSERIYWIDLNRILLPLKESDSGQTLLIRLESTTENLGLGPGTVIGDYYDLAKAHTIKDITDIILGSALIFSAVVMLISSLFLEKSQRRSWVPLCLVVLSIGGIMIFYSPFLYTFYGKYNDLFQLFFDIAMAVFMPAFIYFFEAVFGKGIFGIVRLFRIALLVYAFIYLSSSIINMATDDQYLSVYIFISVTLANLALVTLFIIISISTVLYIVQRKRDSLILCFGFGIFATIGAGELMWYYLSSQAYDLFLWKWGLVAFILSLIMLLGRRYAHQNRLVIQYSKELEHYNEEMQQSEKREIISQLAASVAHEIRNPLQVTRGFLQLLEQKLGTKGREAAYLGMAVEELDRASSIITNFLNFAKPQLEDIQVFDLGEELRHIVNMIGPLANLHGGIIDVHIAESLYVRGSSSKMKQVLINLIKNSIEALNGTGKVRIWAYEDKGNAVIHIHDTGEGMEESTLAFLGKPYFSNKSKGTGLGLLVTFRIIEAMEGTLEFKSEKGVGTEAIIRLPLDAGEAD
ncbi:HAMP domain-containing histidine kinase [Paenibacillus oenotherae]|uniref:histidine kinase n=1 Tax=Paenibacillus oenotherae TaxID=1435645 RepID=A0ABS7D5C4_9BACL|nr:HAMP domain-containing sensor histidine kinase [Paenibacillus oenotherae]MBW7474681.1 HAMP domain-containing histidine kinase [Paenibacillus oenotherae]